MERNYFKGWYFKCSNATQTIACIPAFHRSCHRESASLQMITDDTACSIPFDTLEYRESPLSIRIGRNIFSERGLCLNIRTNKLTAYGTLRFGGLQPLRYDIMGPFRLVPFMQCRHSVFSMQHRVDGQLVINGKPVRFQQGVGYMEGDCGSSFPKQYIWTQCCFPEGSLMLSVADIPLYGLHMTGIIGVVLAGGREYRIATYLGAKVEYIRRNTVAVRQGNAVLTASLLERNAQPLLAPEQGRMSRTIFESASCRAYYRFAYNGKVICEFISSRASFESEYAGFS